MYNYYLTLEQASRYSEIPVKSWLKWIAQGLVTADSEILSEAPDSDKAKLIRISLSSLPDMPTEIYQREFAGFFLFQPGSDRFQDTSWPGRLSAVAGYDRGTERG